MVVCWGHILLIIMQTEAAILTFEIISFFYSSKNASTKSLKMVGLTVWRMQLQFIEFWQ